MTTEDIDLIRRSFTHLVRQRAATAQIFYHRLFTIAPELRPLFKTDLAAQGLKFVDTIALCVGQLDHGPFLEATLGRLGQRHASYGVEPEHYGSVRQALLWTVEERLGPDCTPEVKAAWAALYDQAAATMTAVHRR